MLQRVKQLVSAITAKLDKKDLAFINSYLTVKEARLFFEMDLPTQKHCLKVAKTSLLLAQDYVSENITKVSCDLRLLVKASLLHDIGKPAGGLKTWHRIFIVLTKPLISPTLFHQLSEKLPPSKSGILGGLRYAFYLQKNHPVLGGKLGNLNSLDKNLVSLIERHHTSLSEGSPIELKLLQKADALN